MKYLKYFKTDVDCQNYFNSDEFVTPNVSYAEDANIMYYKPYVEQETEDLIIMTSKSNPEVMKVCHNQGWAASPDKMYASEAARVTSIGTAFERLGNGDSDGYGYNEYSSGYDSPSTSFTFSFDEFKYFTGVTSIGGDAFNGCKGLTSITIPDSVTSIGYNAFYGCSGLTSITIPDSVISIGSYAFKDCDSLPVENGLRYADTYLVKAVDKSLSTYTIKEGTKWIGEGAFYECSGLTSITIPNSVSSIGDTAFYGCKGLTSITIPDSVSSIGDTAFYDCSSLNNITCLATTAPSISSNTFRGIKYFGKLQYPAGSNYSSWMSTSSYYLGYYKWTTEEKSF